MTKIYRYLFGIIFALHMCSGPLFAEPVRDAHTQVELTTDVSAIQPDQPFWVGLYMDMDGRWQTYWKNPGDSGLATAIKWELPEGFKAGQIQWPFPIRMDYPELTSYGYEEKVLLLTKITPPEGLEAGSQQTIKAHVTWLACGKICVPGKADLSLVLSVQSEEPAVDEPTRAVFDKAMADWPLTKSKWMIGAYDEGNSFRLHIIPPDKEMVELTQVVFFPERSDLIDHKAKQEFFKVESGYQLVIPKSAIAYKNTTQLEGVLVAQETWQDNHRALAIDEPINF